MERGDPDPERDADSRRMTEDAFSRIDFPVYEITVPRLTDPMIGDAHVGGGVVESVGIAYGNPMTGGPVTQVISARSPGAKTVDELLDVEMGAWDTGNDRAADGSLHVN